MQESEPGSDGAAIISLLAAHHLRFPKRAARVRMIHLPTPDHRSELMIIVGDEVSSETLPVRPQGVRLHDAAAGAAKQIMGHAKEGFSIEASPRILLIAREPLNPGAEAAYDAVLAVKLGCPHPYLALQPVSGAKNEVWWFNGFDSQDELNSVAEAYKTNEAWNAALTKNQRRKEPLTGKGIEQLADLEPKADSQPWAVGRARYVVVAINPAVRLSDSSVFQGRDGTRYEILMANAREEAERVARGVDFVVLEVVPRWSFPARDWSTGIARCGSLHRSSRKSHLSTASAGLRMGHTRNYSFSAWLCLIGRNIDAN